jgi:hypothetical protein
MFDPSGHELGNAAGFRGWSGGARRSFRISRGSATPGYLPGPITPGRWHVILGPVAIVPPGVDWTLTVTLHFGAPGPAFEPTPAPRSVPGTGRRWYRGDLHLHTVHSDGQRCRDGIHDPWQAWTFASTEHNTNSASLVWGRRPGDGLSSSTRGGHHPRLTWPRSASRARGRLAVPRHRRRAPRSSTSVSSAGWPSSPTRPCRSPRPAGPSVPWPRPMRSRCGTARGRWTTRAPSSAGRRCSSQARSSQRSGAPTHTARTSPSGSPRRWCSDTGRRGGRQGARAGRATR